jgi:Rad52/22 family double-strand break repair protein
MVANIHLVQRPTALEETASSLAPDPAAKFKAFQRPLLEILSDLEKQLPDRLLESRKQGGAELRYIPWHTVAKLLDYYAPGWEGQVIGMHTTGDRIFVTCRITLHAAEGTFTREATGTEVLKEEAFDKRTGDRCWRELAYGDPSSNAESMAFRRAAAKFGLGRYLYEKK